MNKYLEFKRIKKSDIDQYKVIINRVSVFGKIVFDETFKKYVYMEVEEKPGMKMYASPIYESGTLKQIANKLDKLNKEKK